MLEFLFGTLIYAFWFAFLVGPSILFFLRLYIGIHYKIKGTQLIKLLFLPLSIGYFMTFPEESSFKKIYRIVIGFNFAATLLGSLFMIYMVIN